MKRRLIIFLLAAALLISAAPTAALAVGDEQYSDPLVEYIKKGEGFRAMPYSDGAGHWLIGYGCVCNPADYPSGITEAQAEALLREKMDLFADAVNKFLRRYGVTVTQGQFDAMCALSYNLGTAWLSADNRLPSMLIQGLDKFTEQEIATAYGVWCHVGSRPNEHLLARRCMELSMFFDGDYSMRTDAWTWLILDPDGGANAYSDVALYRTGQPFGVLPSASRSGWYLAGWRTAAGWMLSASDLAEGARSVTAVWSRTPPETPAPEEPAPTPEPESSPEPEPAPAPEEVPEESPFPDVAVTAWYAPYVLRLTKEGVVNGFEDGSFRPDDAVTWGQALKLAVRTAGFAEQEAEKGEHWAEGYRAFAERNDWPAPAEDALDRAITRYELAALVDAALEHPAPSEENPYADTDDAAVLALYAAGIMEGSMDGDRRLFLGDSALRRSEICAVLTRMADYVAEHFVFVSGYRRPIDFDLRMSEFEDLPFSTDARGRLVCDDPTVETRFGVDVSAYQNEIDWAAAAADGVEFAMLRCGYRGWGFKGTLAEDAQFRANLAGTKANGIDTGVYFFSQAMSPEEAREEAEFVLELLDGAALELPVVFDWEQITQAGSRSARPDWDTVTDCAVVFCEAIRAAGYTPMVYFNKHMAYLQYDLRRLQDYDAWLAWYHPWPDFVYAYRMWQYGHGSVDGIGGSVDVDILLTRMN